jgi:hypothetical protein
MIILFPTNSHDCQHLHVIPKPYKFLGSIILYIIGEKRITLILALFGFICSVPGSPNPKKSKGEGQRDLYVQSESRPQIRYRVSSNHNVLNPSYRQVSDSELMIDAASHGSENALSSESPSI